MFYREFPLNGSDRIFPQCFRGNFPSMVQGNVPSIVQLLLLLLLLLLQILACSLKKSQSTAVVTPA